MASEIKPELAAYIKQQQTATALLTSFLEDTSIEYKELYEAACSMVEYNIENALLLMINIVLSKSLVVDEAIRDSALLWIQYEGNRNTHKYLLKLLDFGLDEDTKQYIHDMIDSITWKYTTLGLKLVPEQ